MYITYKTLVDNGFEADYVSNSTLLAYLLLKQAMQKTQCAQNKKHNNITASNKDLFQSKRTYIFVFLVSPRKHYCVTH